MIKKIAAKRALLGIPIGIAVEYAVSIIMSMILNLGYFMPTFAVLPEMVGGEINAVLVQAAASALIGAAIGAASALVGKRAKRQTQFTRQASAHIRADIPRPRATKAGGHI